MKLKWLLNNELPLLFLISFTPQTNLFPLLKSYLLERVCWCSRVYDDEYMCTHKVEIKAGGNAIFNEVLIKRNE